MKYDDASWHYGGEFPDGQPIEHGGTHIAHFLRWCFAKGWAGEIHLSEEPEAVQEVVEGSMTPTDFLFDFCDGQLTDENLSPEGAAFADLYYGETGLYLNDYVEHFGKLMYRRPDTDHGFARFSAMVERRLHSKKLTSD